jgi:chromosome segregation ATPase
MKNKLLTIIIILQSFIIIGCKTTTPPVAIPVPPSMVPSVVPQLVKVKDGIDNSLTKNTKIEGKIKDQKVEISNQQASILDAIKRAESIKKDLEASKPITEVESTKFIELMHQIKTRNLFIEKQNEELETIRKEQEVVLKIAKEDAAKTHTKLVEKEYEASSLRDQNNFLGRNLLIKSNEAEALKKEVSKKEIALAKANVYKHWVWGLIGGFIAWTIIKNLLMFYFPTTRFRI